MNKNKQKLFAFSIAAILTISIISISQMPAVFAVDDDDDDDDRKKQKFSKKTHFETVKCIITPDAQSGLPTIDGVDCMAKAWFDKNADALKYKIKISGMDITGSDGDTSDDIGKMHFHKAVMWGDPATKLNPIMSPQHVLNIFKQPAQDDDDLVIKPLKGIFKGIWNDSDAVDRDGVNDDTKTVTEMQNDLCNGNVFLMVHGTVVNDDGSVDKPGYLKAVLKPTADGEKFCEKKLDVS